MLEVGPQQAAVFFSQRSETEAFERFRHPGIFALTGESFEREPEGGTNSLPNMLQGFDLRVVHYDRHGSVL